MLGNLLAGESVSFGHLRRAARNGRRKTGSRKKLAETCKKHLTSAKASDRIASRSPNDLQQWPSKPANIRGLHLNGKVINIMQSYTIEVSKKENNAYVPVGEVTVFYPLLSELGLPVEPSGKDDAGFPTYADERVQYVFDAVMAAVKAAARNKLYPQSATLKEGNKIAETVEELLASGGRSGEALETRRAFLAAFKAWLPSLGKPAGFNAAMADLVSSMKNLPYMSTERKAAVNKYVAEFAASLPADMLAKFERILTQIDELCSSIDPLLE